jgi:hypothetical protein
LSVIEPYYVIENYLTKEQCDHLLKFFIENEDTDPREFYGNLGLGNAERFLNKDTIEYFNFDPEHLLHKMMVFGKQFFLEKYKMRGTSFELNRSHVNYMHTGAYLDSHNDDRKREDPIEGLNSMTYVMGLFLNDDYEGGELYFEDLNVSLKPKPGTLVFFPGFYTCHGVSKVTSGTRINILSHFFDVVDPSIQYKPDYAVAPPDTSSLAV